MKNPADKKRVVNEVKKYHPVAMLLHWLLAIAILAQSGLGKYMADIPKGTPDRATFFNLHKSIGMVIALVILYRLYIRLKHRPPELPAMPKWEHIAATASHHLLYICMILIPLSGYIGSNFTKYGVKFFGYPLPPWGSENKAIYEVFNTTHIVCANLMLVIVAVHIIAALKHQFIDKDTILARMLPGGAAREG